MGNEEEEEKSNFSYLWAMSNITKKELEEITKYLECLYKRLYHNSSLSNEKEEEEKERNDVFIYKTLRYPPKSTPPAVS